MGRREQSLFEATVEVTAKMPWWLGLVLAAVAYFGLHAVASTPVPATTDLKQFGDSAVKQIYTTFAFVLQYLLPSAFIFRSIMSVFARRKRANLFTRATASSDAINRMTWRDFELLVAEYFRRRGFSVKELGGAGPDGGVDLIVSAGTDRYVVQCKKWKARQVGVAAVRSFTA